MDSEGGPQEGSDESGLLSSPEIEKRLASVVVSALDKMLNKFADGLRDHFTPERVKSIIDDKLKSMAEEDDLRVQDPADNEKLLDGDGEQPLPSRPTTENQAPAPQTPVPRGTEEGRKKERIIAGKYRLIKKIGSGSFGSVYSAENISTRKQVAIKLEDKNATHPQLSREHDIYKNFQGAVGIPKIHWFGQERDHKALVMDLLSSNLKDLLKMFKPPTPNKFSLKTVLMLTDQMISLVEYVHNLGIIHRDIKPENFMMGTGSDKNQVFLIDFGLSKRYLDPINKKHISHCTGFNLTGTARYCSINAHHGDELSRRDDMESLGYTFIYLLTGTLPWKNSIGTTPTQTQNKMKQMKTSMSLGDICKGLPREFFTYLSYCRSLRFEQTPDYLYLRRLFMFLYESEGFEHDNNFDWTAA